MVRGERGDIVTRPPAWYTTPHAHRVRQRRTVRGPVRRRPGIPQRRRPPVVAPLPGRRPRPRRLAARRVQGRPSEGGLRLEALPHHRPVATPASLPPAG